VLNDDTLHDSTSLPYTEAGEEGHSDSVLRPRNTTGGLLRISTSILALLRRPQRFLEGTDYNNFSVT
jgi:hypothetical protein